MQPALSDKKVLIVRGSLLADAALQTALAERGAKTVIATNIISAFALVERDRFEAVVVDKGLHNEAVELCAELRSLDVPYVVTDAPHVLQKPGAQERVARDVAARLAKRILACDADEEPETSRNLAGQFPVAKGMASMGVIDPARF